jgi:hypothetical protein
METIVKDYLKKFIFRFKNKYSCSNITYFALLVILDHVCDKIK